MELLESVSSFVQKALSFRIFTVHIKDILEVDTKKLNLHHTFFPALF